MASFDFSQISAVEKAAPITTAHFGGIYSTFHGLASFLEQAEILGINHVRWPGGTRGEHALDTGDKDGDADTDEYLYDLNHDNLLTIPGKGLSDALQAAVSKGGSLSLFLPSVRYFDDLETAKTDAYNFLERLIAGDYGPLPNTLTIELGNESLDGTMATAIKYGAVANFQLQGVGAALAGHDKTSEDFGIKFAIQIGRTSDEDAAIRAEMSGSSLNLIDSLIVHHLPVNIYNHNRILDGEKEDLGDNRFTRSVDYVEAWSRDVAEARKSAFGELDLIASAWTVGPSSDVDMDVLIYQDIGARQARTTIDTFANLIAVGTDAMSLWGLDARSNPNWYSVKTDGVIELSHGGEVFRMLAESVDGMTLLDTYSQDWAVNQSSGSSVSLYAFEDMQKYVVFLAADDLNEAATTTLRFKDIDVARSVEVERLTTLLDEEGTIHAGSDQARLHEKASVSNTFLDIDEPSFDFTLTEDFEVSRLTIWKDSSGDAIQWNPLDVANVLKTDDGLVRTVVRDRDESWTLRGTSADEKILDNAGDDLIEGGGGADHFIFRSQGGKNVIFDFDQSGGAETFDMLVLKGFGYETPAEAAQHIHQTDAGLMFSDQGTSVLLDGYFGDALDLFL